MASTTVRGMVIHIFSPKNLEESQWLSLLQAIELNISDTLQSPSSQRTFLAGTTYSDARVVELFITSGSPSPSLEDCRKLRISSKVQSLEEQYNVEIVIQPAELYAAHKQPGLAVFDMDSTLIQQEVIDELARAVGLYDQVAAITEAAMRGEAPYTDFEASLRARVALLKGVPLSIWDELRTKIITFTPGVPETARVLKALGWKLAVLSGGFTPLANWVKETLGLDYAHANHLVADEQASVLTGELVPGAPIVHGQRKQQLLLEIAAENGIPTERSVAVGDGSNDLPMMGVAGLGVAFNAKPKVQQAAPARLNSGSMLDLFYILGYTKAEIDAILAGESR